MSQTVCRTAVWILSVIIKVIEFTYYLIYGSYEKLSVSFEYITET